MTPPLTLAQAMEAAKSADWMQVVLNQGPPCFHYGEEGRFCLRAQRWMGHTERDEYPEHRFISLADLLLALPSAPQEPPQEPLRPDWADWPAPGTCGRGHAERQPKCPACHDTRIAAMEAAKRVASAPQTGSTEADLEEAKLLIHEWCQRDGYPGGIAAIGVKALAHILAAERASAPPQGWQPIAESHLRVLRAVAAGECCDPEECVEWKPTTLCPRCRAKIYVESLPAPPASPSEERES